MLGLQLKKMDFDNSSISSEEQSFGDVRPRVKIHQPKERRWITPAEKVLERARVPAPDQEGRWPRTRSGVHPDG